MLPNELLVEIFHLVAAVYDGNIWKNRAMGVCRCWRDIILKTPLLWNEIDLSKDPQFVRLCLARSEDTSISLYLAMQSPHPRILAIRDFPALVSLLELHHPRISHVDLYVDWTQADHQHEDPGAMLRMLEACLPALESMSLVTGPGLSLRLTRNYLPRIQSLSLSGVTIDWTSLPLPNLTSLKLCDVIHPDASHPGCLASLLDVLDTCNGLENFTYEQWHAVPGLEPVAAVHIVSLPHMQRFFVSGSPRDILEILTHISLPRGAHLSVELFELGADQDLDIEHLPILAAVLPRSATRLPALADVRHLMVWFEQFKLTIYADEDRTEFWESQAWKTSDYKCSPSDGDTPVMPALCMAYHLPGSEVDHYLLVNVMRELGQYFSSSLETLIVHGIMDIVETETWAGVLAAFPQLEYLEVISRECDMKYFPAALEPTPTATPCRGLRKLVLRYEPNDEDGGLQMLNALCVALQKRDEAHCRLQSLSLQVEPVTIDTMYTPSTAVSRLPADFEDIQEKLEILVDSLEVMLLIDGD